MLVEVEQKYRVTDFAEWQTRLITLGTEFRPPVMQVDAYFNHPSRDFAVTDEAFRVRSVGDENVLTYKGPKLDRMVKTRRELELAVAPGAAAAGQFAELFELLGFRPTAVVRKQRTAGTLTWGGVGYEICLDEVEEVGRFLEIERVVSPDLAEAAREQIGALQQELGLPKVERRSYLAMLLGRSDA